MKVALGSDHGGYNLKSEIRSFLESDGHRTLDCGTNTPEPCDYPKFAYKVAHAVSTGRVDVGVLICKSGNGMAMAANKLPNVRAAICFDKSVAALSRQHNDANILVLGSEHLFDEPEQIVRSWLDARFEGGRHKRRVDQITAIEGKARAIRAPKKAAKTKRKAK